jgi:hypothetical protein
MAKITPTNSPSGPMLYSFMLSFLSLGLDDAVTSRAGWTNPSLTVIGMMLVAIPALFPCILSSGLGGATPSHFTAKKADPVHDITIRSIKHPTPSKLPHQGSNLG